MPAKCKTVINLIEGFAPTYLAESWDNVGLQVGDIGKTVGRVMVCLEVTDTVINEAIAKNIDMIITHHPLIFKPMKSVCLHEPIGGMIYRLIQSGIVLYCAHTNLDIAYNGTNDAIAEALNLEKVIPLKKTYVEKYYKLVVFVPETHVEVVRKAICGAGAGHIGKYSHCTYQTAGTGTFMPLEGSTPFIGMENMLERVSEYRLETIVKQKDLRDSVDRMLEAHPYEEVAYDLYELTNEIESYGMGRIGFLPESMKLSLLCEEIKLKLSLQYARVVGDVNRSVQKIALCTGSGTELIYDAYKAGCDCFITGDVKYHDAQYALQLGISIIDAGHFETEDFACKMIAQTLRKMSKQQGCDIEVLESSTYINPFHML